LGESESQLRRGFLSFARRSPAHHGLEANTEVKVL
jgi:hypothetical protein